MGLETGFQKTGEFEWKQRLIINLQKGENVITQRPIYAWKINMKILKLIKKNKQNKQNSDSSVIQFERTPECIERANLILSERKTAGIQWEIHLDGKQVTQYSYFVNNVSEFCVGTEAIDEPNILLNRDVGLF